VELRELPLDELHESASNPRRTYDAAKLDELAESIRAEGVLEPIMVRPSSVSTNDAEWEIVFGSRRVRAARLAGLVSVPALIRADLSDAQALELQIAENNQRADVSPIDEADAILALVEQHGRDAHDVAARLGRSLPWVRARLALAGAEPRIREALAQGIIGEGSAAMLARLPAEQQQDIGEDLHEQDTYRRPDGRWSTGGVRRLLIDRQRTHRLALATWDLRDATLGTVSTSCDVCPKRSNAQVALFGEAPLDDLCLDRTCWAWKTEASDARKIAAAVDEGRTVITGDAARELLGQHNALAWDGEWISLDDTTPYGMEGLGDTDEVPWREVIGDKIAPTLIAIDGQVMEVVPRAALVEVVRKLDPDAAGKIEREGARGAGNVKAMREAEAADVAERKAAAAAELALERAASSLAMGELVKCAENDDSEHEDLWLALARAIAYHVGLDGCAAVCERRGLEYGHSGIGKAFVQPVDVLRDLTVELGLDELRGLAVELAAHRSMISYATASLPAHTAEMLAAFDVSMAACRHAAERDAKAAAKAAKKTTKKRSAA
jgi:ParB/RepB/Spo0J family partition protein